ncbi:MAG: hypothetical protein FWF84_02140 [Kiritimatiellaeota bacterium]|nr:hypothetical protein [Kiritimatiellota bacterium]
MANTPDINKRQCGIRLRIELLKKIEQLAKRNNRPVFDELAVILEYATRNVVLSSKDYEDIANEVKHNEAKRKAHKRRSGHQSL